MAFRATKVEKIKEDLEQYVNMLAEYIRINSESSGWVVITLRDVPQLTGVSSYWSKKVVELLKEHSNIVFEVYESSKSGRKPFRYKYVENESEKIESILTEKNFYYLNQSEIDFVQNKLQSTDYKHLFKTLSFVNYLVHIGAKDRFIDFKINEATKLLVESKTVIENILNELIFEKIIVDKDGLLKLKLNSHDLSKQEDFCKTVENLQIDNIDGNTESDILPSDNLSLNQSLLDNMKNFTFAIRQMQNEFREFFDEKLNAVLVVEKEKNNASAIQVLQEENTILTNMLEKQEIEINEGLAILQKFSQENSSLTEKIQEIEQENSVIIRTLENKQKYTDRFVENAQEVLDTLLGEIVVAINSYARMPSWQQSPTEANRMQSTILRAVTNAVTGMINYRDPKDHDFCLGPRYW